jgi:quercetin dioxygenase-like cupin family protein
LPKVEAIHSKEDPMADRLIKSKGIPFQELKPGVSRRILGYIDQLMLVEMRFKKGTIGEPHGHSHAQTGYVLQGSFEVQMGEKKEILREGDCYLLEPHIIHGVVCLEDDSRLLDVFTPKREDFLNY